MEFDKLWIRGTRDFAWTEAEMNSYHGGNYLTLSNADRHLAGVAITAIAREGIFSQFASGIIFGAGGVPRGAGIILPTLQETAELTVTDVTSENVELTRQVMDGIKQNDPRQAHWRDHEHDMAAHDHRWTHAIGKAAARSVCRVVDLNDAESRMAAVAGMEYVAESACDTREEYEYFMKKFADSAEEMVYQAFSVESNGWDAGNRNHPAYSVSVDQNAEQLERNGFRLISDPHEGFAPASHELRQESDTHDYAGFATVVAVRK